MEQAIELLMNREFLYRTLSVISVEIAGVIILCFVIYLIVNGLFSQIESIPFLREHREWLTPIHRRIRGILYTLGFIFCASILVFNGYLIYEQADVLTFTLLVIERMPSSFWTQLAVGISSVIGFAILAKYINHTAQRWLSNLQNQAKSYRQIRANDESIERFFTSLSNILKHSIWILTAAIAVRILPLPTLLFDSFLLFFKIYLCISIGLLAVKAVSAIVDTLDALGSKYIKSENLLLYYQQLKGLMPLLRRCLEYMVYILVATLVTMQVDFVAELSWYGPGLVQIIGIYFLSRVVLEIMNLLVDKAMLTDDEISALERQRRLTIIPLIKSLLTYLIYLIVFVLSLNAVAINPAPILAGAGLVGLVIGLGAQPLINDLVSGFFIIIENLYLVGDYIETGSARGIVEAIDIRTTRIRDPNGQQHILRNGQLGEVINYSKNYTFAVVEVGVAYESDLDHVYRVLQEVGSFLIENHPDALEKTRVEGLVNFGESELLIRTVTKVKPGKHLQVGRDLRKLIKEAFDREGIEIPFAQRVITFKHSLHEQLLPPELSSNGHLSQKLEQSR